MTGTTSTPKFNEERERGLRGSSNINDEQKA